MTSSMSANSGLLRSLIWRRERVGLIVWLVALVLLNVMVVLAYGQIYQSDAERQAMAETMRNPAMISMLGKGWGLDNYHVGAMMEHQMLLFTALGVAIMNILLVSRHTRAEEEAGRVELIRSLAVGRLANLGSIFTVSLVTNLVLAVVMGVSLYACGVENMDLQGSLIYGSVLGVVGVLFAGVTALFAQLTETSRGTLGYSFLTLGAFYLLRAVGDVGNEALSLISPLGLALRAQAFVLNFWWPIFATLGISFLFWLAAFYLNVRRDLGAGLISAKPGRKNASVFLSNPVGLILRLQRTMIISWLVGLFFLGISYGSVFGDLELFIDNNEFLKEILPVALGFSLTDQFLAMLMSVLAMIAAIPAMLMVFKLRAEEKTGRLEGILARAVSRSYILATFFSFGVVVGALGMFLAALGIWIAAKAVMDVPIGLKVIFQGSVAQFPAIFVMVAVCAFFVGWLPKYMSLVWVYLGYSFFSVYFGVLLKLPEWMKKASPFGHGAKIPIEPFEPISVIILMVMSVALFALGIVGYRRRDMD